MHTLTDKIVVAVAIALIAFILFVPTLAKAQDVDAYQHADCSVLADYTGNKVKGDVHFKLAFDLAYDTQDIVNYLNEIEDFYFNFSDGRLQAIYNNKCKDIA